MVGHIPGLSRNGLRNVRFGVYLIPGCNDPHRPFSRGIIVSFGIRQIMGNDKRNRNINNNNKYRMSAWTLPD